MTTRQMQEVAYGRRCILECPQVMEEIRENMRERGEDQDNVRCPYHRDYHAIGANDLELQAWEHGGVPPKVSKDYEKLAPVPSNANPNFCRYPDHRTSATWLIGQCAYCGAEIHVHLDMLSKRRQNCSKCHRVNGFVAGIKDGEAWKLKKKDKVEGLVTFTRIDQGVQAAQGVLIEGV